MPGRGLDRTQVAMTVEVVRADVEDDGDTGVKPLRGFELEGRDLEDGHIEGPAQECEGRCSEVARCARTQSAGAQHGFDQHDRRGFPVCACNCNN